MERPSYEENSLWSLPDRVGRLDHRVRSGCRDGRCWRRYRRRTSGAAVGATVGAVAGGIADESRPRFRTYVGGQRHTSYRYDREIRVGADLPSSGVTYYEVPR